MSPINVIALFCEDIREEVGGINTLVGIMPDNIGLNFGERDKSNKMLLKLCIYTRIHFDPEFDLGEIQINLAIHGEETVLLGVIDVETVNTARSKAKEQGNLLAGVISRVILAGFRPPKSGLLKLEVIAYGETHVAGSLNFKAVSGSNVGALPSSQ